MFDSLHSLTYLELTIRTIPEFLFKNLTKLKELKLVLRISMELNSNHFDGLENLEIFELRGPHKLELNKCLGSMLNLKNLELECVTLNQFSLLPFEKVEKLKLWDHMIKFKRFLNSSVSNNNEKIFFQNLKYLEINTYWDNFIRNLKEDILKTIPPTVETLKIRKNSLTQ